MRYLNAENKEIFKKMKIEIYSGLLESNKIPVLFD